MKPTKKLKWVVVLLATVILAAASLAALIPSKASRTVVKARLLPPSAWRVGLHRVDICASSTPNMAGWNLNLGPVWIAKLEPWQLSTVAITNVISLQATNTITGTPTTLR
jgi:hypothetical protein